MLEVKINIGNGQIVTLRGVKNGTFELCNASQMKDKVTGEYVPTLVGFSFYTTLEACFDAIMKYRIARSDARTLEELQHVIKREHRKLKDMFDGFIESTEEVENIHEDEKPSKTRGLNRTREPKTQEPPASAIPETRQENPVRRKRRLAAETQPETTSRRRTPRRRT